MKQVTITEDEYKSLKSKSDKWDKLDKKLSNMYYDGDGNERDDDEFDLSSIGEAAASAFGYL